MRRLVQIGLGLWLATMMVAGGVLLLRHTPLAIPSASDRTLRAGIASISHPRGQWQTVHVMYRSCTCSKKTIEHLLARRSIAGVDEHVLVVDDDDQSAAVDEQLREAGYSVVVITPQQLRDRFAIHSAPVLVVARPDGRIAYVGGYNRHKQEARFMDVAILRDLLDGDAQPLPVFGCSTSDRLARTP